MNLLCKIGIHRPLRIKSSSFTDAVSGATVFNAECSCKKQWLTDGVFGWFGFRVPKDEKITDDMITCTGCGKEVEENGYCEKDGSPYGDCCWSEHIENCDACKEQSEC